MTTSHPGRLRPVARLSRLCAALLLVSTAGGTPHLRAQAPVKTTRQNDIIFAKGIHGDLLADLYLPARPGLRPAVVFLHGGAWKSGDRTQLTDVAIALAQAGYVGMAPDYDLTSQGARFPIALHESEAAIAWLREHAAQYAVDPSRIAVAGSSAGGELAALLALDPSAPPVQAAVVFNGVLDLSYVGPDAEDMVAPYLGGSCQARLQLCQRASPVSRVHPQAPPFFVGHGTEDRIVPYSQAKLFVQRLRDDHVAVTPFIATGAGHTYWKADAWFKPNIAAVLSFLAAAMPAK